MVQTVALGPDSIPMPGLFTGGGGRILGHRRQGEPEGGPQKGSTQNNHSRTRQGSEECVEQGEPKPRRDKRKVALPAPEHNDASTQAHADCQLQRARFLSSA